MSKEWYHVNTRANYIDFGYEIAVKRNIERRSYPEISDLVSKDEQALISMVESCKDKEDAIFASMMKLTEDWEQFAAEEMRISLALEYLKINPVSHTSNQWVKQDCDEYAYIKSNRVYEIATYIKEETIRNAYTQEITSTLWRASWYLGLNLVSEDGYKIDGQIKRNFSSKEIAEKYIHDSIAIYENLFTEINPRIPPMYAEYFKVNGVLLPEYNV